MSNYTEEAILLKIDNITKDYNGKLVLKNVCVDIKDIRVASEVKGQVVGFIGPSGIGKSTLFRIMAGLDKPTSGKVTLAGSDLPVCAGQVGVVAQSYPLFAHRTVLGNLMLAAKKSFGDHKKAYDTVIAYLNEFGLHDHINHYPAELSGGQRQRCAIIQQVLSSNKYILMDEPFSGLDPIAKKKTQALIQKIANLDELNTIIIVTHDIVAAVSVVDHLWMMGRDRDQEGNIIPGAYIVKTYNLIDEGLAWHSDITKTPEFGAFVHKINKEFEVL